MAVKFIAAIKRWSGLSTDTKPTTGAPVGSTFRETDTGEAFWYDGTSWNVDFPVIDGFTTGAAVGIDIVHYKVHAGEHYTATYRESISSGSASVILIETPGSATGTMHFEAMISTSAAGEIDWQKAPNATAGTVITSNNNDQTSANTADLDVWHNGAVTSAGTSLTGFYTGGGASGKVGGETGLRNEWKLNHSARYLLQYTASAASIVIWNLFWYEED